MKKVTRSVGKKRVSLMTLAVAFCCALAATVLGACGGDDDNPGSGTGTGTEKKAVGVAFEAAFEQTEDMLKYCDITVEYNNGTEIKHETVTTTLWEKTIFAKLPSTVTFRRTVTLKDGVDLSSVKYLYFSNGYDSDYCLVDAANTTSWTLSVSTSSDPQPISSDKVADYIAKGSSNITICYSFDADGKATEIESKTKSL